MMRKIALLTLLLTISLGLTVASLAADYGVLRPGAIDGPDVKAFKSIHPKKDVPKPHRVPDELLGPTGIVDTLTWRDPDASDLVNFGFLNHGDSMLVWLDPPAACSLVAIRFRPINWEGNLLLDIWNAKNYDPLIYSTDSTDGNGWWGTFEPITSPSGWIPGDISAHSPLGMNAMDPTEHYWGPFPYTVTAAHADVWIEVPARLGIQGEIDLKSDPFYIGGSFYVTDGWGFYSQYDYTTPFNFFKFYSAGEGPGPHDGWFIRQYFMWYEAIVRFYENTPPKTESLQSQNWTYRPGPFEIQAVITDQDAEDPNRAGVVLAELVYEIDGVQTRLTLEPDTEENTYVATIPTLNQGDFVQYWVEAEDAVGAVGISAKQSFMRTRPENPGADILLIWDYAGDDDLDTMFNDLFAEVDDGAYTYELWNNVARNGIDASVVNWGWKTIYISGWGCGNTIPGFEYEGNIFVDWLEAGTTEEPHNLLYVDQDYFCIHDEAYDCDWDEELMEDDFMFDYCGVLLPVSDNHGADVGGYDSVAIGQPGTEFEGIRVNFMPDAWDPTDPALDLWPDWLIDLNPEGEQIFYYKDTEFGAGVRVDMGHYKTCFLPWADFFAFDSLENGDLVPREGLVQTVETVLTWFGTGTSVSPAEGSVTVPESYTLSQNYPNPFNPETRIDYQLPSDGWVELSVYNVLGQKVRTLVAEQQTTGAYTATWDGRDEVGLGVASGVYFYRLNAGDFTSTKRMILMR